MFDYVEFDIIPQRTELQENLSLLPNVEDIIEFSPLFWAEHCLECSPPDCYQSCQMYQANSNGRCKRLKYISKEKIDGYEFPVYRLCYKKWAKLRCPYNSSIKYPDVEEFLNIQKKHSSLLSFTRIIDIPSKLLPKHYRNPFSRMIHHNYIKRMRPVETSITGCKDLLLIFYAEPKSSSKLILDSYDFSHMLLTRNMWDVRDGINIWKTSTNDLSRNNVPIYALELYPDNNNELEITVLFSDLVTLKNDSKICKSDYSSDKALPAPKVKCVAWDLDNTIWNGIIGEDGVDEITIKPEVLEIIKQLDKRGILNTICSKNDEDIALLGLDKFGIRDYFLYPQINWKPKSENLLEISKMLNINIDTFAFIDDSFFERNEVSQALSNVRVYTDEEIDDILNKPEFDVPITDESVKRRSFYMAEEYRKELLAENGNGDYKSFILSCEFKIEVSECKNEKDINRCHELLMRTNQLNSSTNRIPYDTFLQLVQDESKHVYKVKCNDKYGEYGIVGCLIIEKYDNRLLCTDFVVSCRVAKKKVESGVIMYLMKKHGLPMDIVYRPSDRNHVLKEEFDLIGGEYDVDRNLIHFKMESILDYDWATVIG